MEEILCGQFIRFGLPFLRGDRLTGSFQIFQIPGGGFIQGKLRTVTLFKQIALTWLHLIQLAADSFVLYVLRPHFQVFVQHFSPAFPADDLPAQFMLYDFIINYIK